MPRKAFRAGRPSRIGKCGKDVLPLQTGIEPQHAVDRLAAGQQAGDGADGDADASDAGLAAHYSGVDGDSVEVWEGHESITFVSSILPGA